MKAYSITDPKSRDDDSVHAYSFRVVVGAQLMRSCLVLAMALTVPGGLLLAAGPEPVDLGTAAEFGALAGAAITGSGHVAGDVGSGTDAIPPAITSTGNMYTGGEVVTAALADFSTAYNEGMNRPYDILLSAAAYELGGKTLTPGVYKIGGAATLASPVTLNAKGDPDAVFIIQITGALGATAAVGNVILINDAQSANVFWIVEGAVSMGAGTHMEGTILGGAAIALGAGTTLNGRVMAGTDAGTIAIDTTISVPAEPSLVGGRVWLDSNGDGIQDPTETTNFANVPVALLQVVFEGLTIDLGTAAEFGALAGGAISGTGHVEGHVGSGTDAIADAITSTGDIYSVGEVVTTALADFATAYNDGKNRSYDVLLSAAAYDLGGNTLTPGVYKIGGAATMASPVTFDAEGDPEAVFIIQVVGAISTAADVSVMLANGAESANVFWIVEGAVSMGAGSHMEGTILGGAAIALGAGTTLNGRVMAGLAAGTIAIDTEISAATGNPPVGNPPPIVVANTVSDANGVYLFGAVQPGSYIVRWDLSSVTTDLRVTSDGMSGDVGGFVYTAEIDVQGGSTQLSVDLGLVETLPAVKAAAMDELATALAYLLEENYYTGGNWAALKAARADGDTAILAATDPEGVTTARDTALAAMHAVPTYDETLAAAKVAALDDLEAAQATYLETNYTAEDWTALNTARTDGDIAINLATDLAGVAAAKDAALAAMEAVPTIAITLASAKASALDDLTTAQATHLEENYYTAENWMALKAAKTDGDIAIDAATDPEGVASARDAALAAMNAVPTIADTLIFTDISRTSEGEVTLVLRTPPHFPLTLQTSTDLKSWTTIATATPGIEMWSFVHDAELATGPRRFYRAYLNP